MRLSTNQLFNRGLDTMVDGQKRLAKLYDQISSGKKLQRPGDDPVAAVQIINLKQEIAVNQQYRDNYTALENKLRTEETMLESVNNTVQSIRDLTLQAKNGTQGSTDKKIIGERIEVLLGELTDLVNSRDSDGNYIFGGYQENLRPFTQNADGSFSYNGDDGQTKIRVSNSISIAANDNGRVFMGIPTGQQVPESDGDYANTGGGAISAATVTDKTAYNDLGQDVEIVFVDTDADLVADAYSLYQKGTTTPINDSSGNPLTNQPYTSGAAITFAGVGVSISDTPTAPAVGDKFYVEQRAETQDLLTAVHNLANGLQNAQDTEANKTTLNTLMEDTLNYLDVAQENLLVKQSEVGSRFNLAENALNNAEEFDLIMRTALSSLEDVDYAEAISQLSQESFVLEAAQKSFSKIQGLSLFKFL